MTIAFRRGLSLAALVAASLTGATAAVAAPTDLSTWTQEGSGNWVLAPDNNSVTQTQNVNPGVYYSDFTSIGRSLAGTIRVNTSSDDDFIGFVVGFQPGDMTSASDFLLIDWKQLDQGGPGCTGDAGLAVSRVTAGIPTNNRGAWCHDADGITELARGLTLSDTGWQEFRTYTFEIAYTATNLQVFVDDVLQIDLDGAFSDGRFGFYNYSQQNVVYAGITDTVLPPAVPEPATWAMMILGFGGAGVVLRRRKTAALA